MPLTRAIALIVSLSFALSLALFAQHTTTSRKRGPNIREKVEREKADFGVKHGTPMPFFSQSTKPARSRIEDLWCESEAIVTGIVLSRKSSLHSDETSIITDLELRVDQLQKGPDVHLGAVLTIRRPGGTVRIGDNLATELYSTYAPVEVGNKYTFFLRKIPGTDVYETVGSFGSFLHDGPKLVKTTEESGGADFDSPQPSASFFQKLGVSGDKCTPR